MIEFVVAALLTLEPFSSSAIFQEGNLNDANEAAKEETPTVFDFSNIGDFKADVLCQQYDTPEHLHDQTFYLAH